MDFKGPGALNGRRVGPLLGVGHVYGASRIGTLLDALPIACS